jgi:hypothetical protein
MFTKPIASLRVQRWHNKPTTSLWVQEFWTSITKSNGHELFWRFVIRKKEQSTHHMLDDNVKKKKHISRNNTLSKKMHLSMLECCCRFWLYLMFLKLSSPSSIIVGACLNVATDFGCISCSWNFHLQAPSLLELAWMLLQILVVFHVLETFNSKFHHYSIIIVFCTSLLNMSLNFEPEILVLLNHILIFWVFLKCFYLIRTVVTLNCVLL